MSAARLSALAAASLQVLAYQSIVVYSDTFTALCLLLATWLLLLWVRGGGTDRSLSFAFGLALGIAMGAKYSAGPPAVVLTVFWAWYASRGPQREGFDQPLVDWGALVQQGLWYAAGVLPGMIFWYARNLVREGNPLYPLSVAGLPGIPLDNLLAGAPGPRTFWERVSYPWTETGHILGFETGLGAIVATVVVLAVLMGPWTSQGRDCTVCCGSYWPPPHLPGCARVCWCRATDFSRCCWPLSSSAVCSRHSRHDGCRASRRRRLP